MQSQGALFRNQNAGEVAQDVGLFFVGLPEYHVGQSRPSIRKSVGSLLVDASWANHGRSWLVVMSAVGGGNGWADPQERNSYGTSSGSA